MGRLLFRPRDNAIEPVARFQGSAFATKPHTEHDVLFSSVRQSTRETNSGAASEIRGPGPDAWADATTPHGRLMLTVLGGLAEFERELIRARTGEGRARAKARGVHMGRPPKLTPHQQAEARQRRDNGETLTDIARTCGAVTPRFRGCSAFAKVARIAEPLTRRASLLELLSLCRAAI
jgi:hypothetical protein